MSRTSFFAPLYSFLLLTAACTGTTITTGTTVSSCGSPGANMNEHDTGNEPGGISLDLGEVAVAPSGAFVIFKSQSDLLVGWPGDGSVDQLGVRAPTKLAFSGKSTLVYVGSSADNRLHAVDVALDDELWSAPIPASLLGDLRLSIAGDDSRIIVSAGSRLDVLDALTGASIASLTFDRDIVDARILPGDTHALVVTRETWAADGITPSSALSLISLTDGTTTDFEVPNCASALAITPDGRRAFLSPSFCNKDPISVIDLTPGQEGWMRNLPGFGPLALGPRGATAVAFLDAQNIDTTLFDDPSQIPPHGPTDTRYHIMTLDTKTLTYTFTPWGDIIPRYQLTPDGKSLLVDAPISGDSALRVFDTKDHLFRSVTGAPVSLDNFVLTDDSAHVYALTSGLVDVDIASGTASSLDTAGTTPLNINTSPDGQKLYLRESSDVICIYDIASQDCDNLFVGAFIRPSARR